MLSQEKLLQAIDIEMRICRDAHPEDEPDKTHQILQIAALIRHQGWAENAGTDQTELEQVVRSLETNEVVRGHQRWRELATT